MRALLLSLLLVCLSLPGQAAFDCDACVGLNCAFACAGPNRPPSEDDLPPPVGFELIFGERPAPFGPGGKTVNLRDQVPAIEWAMAKREFSQLVDFDLNTEMVTELMNLTGGMLIAWENKRETTYVALVGGETPLYRIPERLFALKTPVLWILHNIVGRGGCVVEIPTRFRADVLSENNDRNCGREE